MSASIPPPTRPLAVVVALLAILSPSCGGGEQQDITFASVVAAIAPELRLDPKSFPATVQAISQKRSGSRITSLGVQERTAGWDVDYQPTGGLRSDSIAQSDTVRGLVLSRELSAIDSAEVEWDRMLGRFAAVTSIKPVCTESQGPLVRSRVALWQVKDGVVFPQVVIGIGTRGGVLSPTRIVIGGSSEANMTAPITESGRRIACRA